MVQAEGGHTHSLRLCRTPSGLAQRLVLRVMVGNRLRLGVAKGPQAEGSHTHSSDASAALPSLVWPR